MAVILLVDDSRENRAILRRALEFRGHSCLEAENGVAGLVVARARRPDLILLDISMPVMNGWEAVAVLKATSATRGIPVVALTADTTAEAEFRARAWGFDGFIGKLAPPLTIVAAIENLLG